MIPDTWCPAELVRPLRVVLTSLSSDSHTWNLVYLQLLLEEMGCQVANLGACTPDGTILRACLTQHPDILVISSLNGHGVHDGVRLIRTLRAVPGLAGLPAVIGGRLDATGEADRRTPAALIDAGFDAVFEGSAGIATFRSMVHRLADEPVGGAGSGDAITGTGTVSGGALGDGGTMRLARR